MNKDIADEIVHRFLNAAYDTCQTLADAEPNTLLIYMAKDWWKKMGKPKTFMGQKVIPMTFGDAVPMPMFLDMATEENGA